MSMRLAGPVALALMILSAPGWCDAGSARDKVDTKFYAMLGHFEPVESGFDGHTAFALTYSWRRSSYYAAIEYTRSTSAEVVESVPLGITDQAFGLVGGIRQWPGRWYYGAGIGVSTVRHEITAPLGALANSDTNLAWEVVAGAPFGGRGLVEVKYMDAGDSSLRGFAGFIGVTY